MPRAGATQTRSFVYSDAGRLTTAQYATCVSGHSFSAADMYSYHPAGAVTAKQLRVVKCGYDDDGNYACPVAPLEVDYTYDTMGQVASYGGLTYGSDGMGRHVSLGYALAPACGITSPFVQNGQFDYAGRRTSLQYAYPTGTGSWMDCGSNSYYVSAYFNQTESRTYNVNSQLTSISWNAGFTFTQPNWNPAGSLQYVYPATQNNGQITQMADSFTGETVTYQYDALKRLVSACSSLNNCGTAPTSFQYDGFGNLTSKTLAGVTSGIPVNAGTNQLSNAYYDANGNMTSGAGVTMAYDVANRVKSASPASGGTEYYGYSADNKRVWRLKADGVTEEWTLYGVRGERLGVYQWAGLTEHFDGNGNWTNDTASFTQLRTSVWFDGRLVQENGNWVAGDRLGTNRAGGARFLPYGEETSSTANDRTKFGTYNRDSLTGLDYADQRYYASTYGRFNSPDPYGLRATQPKMPGSWDRYGYTHGDPVNFNDPHGTQDCDASGDGSGPACPALAAGGDGGYGTAEAQGCLLDGIPISCSMIHGEATTLAPTVKPQSEVDIPCEQGTVQSTITSDANSLGVDFFGLGFSFDKVTLAGTAGATQTELYLNGSAPALANLVSSAAFQQNFVTAGSDPLHGDYTLGNWRQNVAMNSIQITANASGSIQVDIDPNNPMYNFLAHSADVVYNTYFGTDTNYHSVAGALGIGVKTCP